MPGDVDRRPLSFTREGSDREIRSDAADFQVHDGTYLCSPGIWCSKLRYNRRARCPPFALKPTGNATPGTIWSPDGKLYAQRTPGETVNPFRPSVFVTVLSSITLNCGSKSQITL